MSANTTFIILKNLCQFSKAKMVSARGIFSILKICIWYIDDNL